MTIMILWRFILKRGDTGLAKEQIITMDDKNDLDTLKKEDNVIVLPVDKGRVTVVKNKQYLDKCQDLLKYGSPTRSCHQIKQASSSRNLMMPSWVLRYRESFHLRSTEYCTLHMHMTNHLNSMVYLRCMRPPCLWDPHLALSTQFLMR